VLEFNSRANIRHSGRHGRRSMLDFDIQGDTDRCVRIRQSGRHDRGSMLEFDIAHNTIRGSRQQAQFDVRGSGDRETGLGGRGSGETGWSTRRCAKTRGGSGSEPTRLELTGIQMRTVHKAVHLWLSRRDYQVRSEPTRLGSGGAQGGAPTLAVCQDHSEVEDRVGESTTRRARQINQSKKFFVWVFE
jgi:hypothetical protein